MLTQLNGSLRNKLLLDYVTEQKKAEAQTPFLLDM